ncbi:MAG: AraC family transcriptional regulator [Verrucomicrobia bacterium]|nr:AraC family transcriptional regulator [Verrucomicrobiota bacterium]
MLDALQIVLITGGRGIFESHDTGRIDAGAGTAFALVPGVWHRYRPDPRTGWEESWLEVQGPAVDRLLKSGVITPKTAVRRDALQTGLDAALEAVHERARGEARGFDPELSAGGYGVLAAWANRPENDAGRQRALRIVTKAERFLRAHHHEAVNVAELARELGMAYSHFRRVFRQHTGSAPWQYVLRMRLARSRRLLASSGDATLEDIADKLGFSSPFHFSTAFKQAHGKSPDQWRRELWRGQSAAPPRAGHAN